MTGTLQTATLTAISSLITGTTSRSLGLRFTDILNAKDFGATGDGVTNDTVGMQAVLDASFGPPNNPHRSTNRQLNRPIFFPSGTYLVRPPAAMTVSAMTRGSDASITGSVSNTILTVTSVVSGTVAVGQEIDNLYGAVIVSNISGSGAGSTWNLSVPATVAGPTAISLVADIVVTVNSTTNYLSGNIVYISGVVATTVPATSAGLGLNWSYGIAVIDSTRFAIIGTRNAYMTFTSYTSGGSIIRAALQVRSVQGFKIFGGGRQATRIITDTTGGSVFASNGMDYGSVEGISFELASGGATDAIAFDFNWDNTSGAALQAVTFRDNAFGGYSTTQGDGLRIGNCGAQGSEILVHNCHFTQLNVGLSTRNQNALEVNVLGGNVASCNTGILIVGSIDTIIGVSFQLGGTWDIDMTSAGSYASAIFVSGCRSERTAVAPGGFLRNQVGTHSLVMNCGTSAGANHTFIEFIGAATIIGCWSPDGRVYSPANNAGSLSGTNNRFDRSDFWQINQISGGVAITSGFNAERLTTDGTGALVNATLASLPTAGVNLIGAVATVYDSSTATIDATILVGGGTNRVMAYCASTAWKVLKVVT